MHGGVWEGTQSPLSTYRLLQARLQPQHRHNGVAGASAGARFEPRHSLSRTQETLEMQRMLKGKERREHQHCVAMPQFP